MAEIQTIRPGPELHVLEDRHDADRIHDVLLRLCPQLQLAIRIRFVIRAASIYLVRDIAMREVGDRQWACRGRHPNG